MFQALTLVRNDQLYATDRSLSPFALSWHFSGSFVFWLTDQTHTSIHNKTLVLLHLCI